MKIVNGEGLVMGRVASYAAKELLKGEEVSVINCDKVLITGSKKNIEAEFKEKRSKMGSSLKGPKHPRSSQVIVKRAIRGMLPNYREGRGRQAWKRLRCYDTIPKELEGKETVKFTVHQQIKPFEVKNLTKK